MKSSPWTTEQRLEWASRFPRVGEDGPRFDTRTPDPDWVERFTRGRLNGIGTLPAILSERGTPDGFTDLVERAKHALRDSLLAVGGWEVCQNALDQDLGAILEHGVVLDGADALLRRGAPSGCHANSMEAAVRAPKRRAVMTGYALSDDGLWRAHSWVAETPVGGGDPMLVETTEPRVTYAGFMQSTPDLLLRDERGPLSYDKMVTELHANIERGMQVYQDRTTGIALPRPR